MDFSASSFVGHCTIGDAPQTDSSQAASCAAQIETKLSKKRAISLNAGRRFWQFSLHPACCSPARMALCVLSRRR